MILKDILYGEFQVEPVIEELINCRTVQRLNNVHMAGAAFLANPLWNETRLEHSIGVMLLIKKLGGSLEEQIAGLLHDVSHTAFSHTIDSALKIREEDYHEQIKDAMIAKSEIPEILSNFGFDAEKILGDESKYFLLEKELPSLCCDRMDYTLREIYRYFNVEIESIWEFLDSLEIKDKEICINDLKWAEWFTEMYNKIVLDFFYDPLNLISDYLLSKIIRFCLTEKLIDENDFMLDDFQLLTKIKNLNHSVINTYLVRLEKPFVFKQTSEADQYNVHLKKKPRIIDPTVLINNQKYKASERSLKVKRLRSEAIEFSNTGVYLEVF